ncbi:feruloyl-CoA synthase [Euzebyella marina]|nr:feruloyl-CoA synthase [Euzebyella marina]
MTQQDTPYLEVPTISIDIDRQMRADGTILLRSKIALEDFPQKVTERLRYWYEQTPDSVLLAQRNKSGDWLKFTYAEVWHKIQNIGQFLLNNKNGEAKPIVVLSGNSWQHGLLALAAQHVGVVFSAISPAYSLKSTDFRKLKHCIELLDPGLIFVQDGQQYASALNSLETSATLVVVENPVQNALLFQDVLETPVTKAVLQAHQKIKGNSIAKILFTSGSTGMPKGVMNTQANLTSNLQQITQTYPFMKNGGLTLIDWLPWSHTFGGNHNFGLAFYNGGTLYIDEGNPTPEGTLVTIKNLREIPPTVYFNVPKGFEELVGVLQKDNNLCETFFSQLKMLFFGGASLSQHVRDCLDALALRTTGKRVLISSGYGMTEACPSTMFNTSYEQRAGNLGVPVPGMTTKLVPFGDAFEVRFKGPNLTPGYWNDDWQTSNAFDEEGFFKSGDALKFEDVDNPSAGLIYDGRITENFKLNSGTWVNVGLLRAQLIAESNGLIRDAVLTGHDKDFVGALLFLNPDHSFDHLKKVVVEHDRKQKIEESILGALRNLAKKNTGATTVVRRAMIARFELSIKNGEVTDKGSINQRAVLLNRKEWISLLHDSNLGEDVLEI